MKMKWHWAIVYLVGFFLLLVFFPSNNKPYSRTEGDRSIVQGDSLLRVRDFEQAVEVYAEVLRMDPENLEAREKKEQAEKIMDLTAALIREGDAAARKNHLDEALEFIALAKELAPHHQDESYLKVEEMVESGEIKALYSDMLELDARWEQIKEYLKKGEPLSSKKISKLIASLHPLAKKCFNGNTSLPSDPLTPEGIRLYNEFKELENYKVVEFGVYQIMPVTVLDEFEENMDEYVKGVKQSIKAFGLDFQMEKANYYYKELVFLKHPEFMRFD